MLRSSLENPGRRSFEIQSAALQQTSSSACPRSRCAARHGSHLQVAKPAAERPLSHDRDSRLSLDLPQRASIAASDSNAKQKRLAAPRSFLTRLQYSGYSSIDEDYAAEARSLEHSQSPGSIRTAAPAGDSAAATTDASPGLLGGWLQRLTPKWLSPRGRGIALLWLLVALVSTNWVLVKDSGGGLDALTFSAMRFAVAALAFSPFLPEALVDNSQTLIPAGIELGVWTSAGYLTQAVGLSTTDASRASFLSTFTVLAVPLLAGSRLGDGRKISPWVWGSGAVALLGVSLLEQGSGSPAGIGDVWSIASAVFFGIQIYRTERLSRTLPPKSTFKLMSISLAVVAAIAAGADIVSHPSQALGLLLDPRSSLAAMTDKSIPWQSVLWTGLLSTDLALLIELSALTTVSSITASLIYTTEPVMGAALAFVLLGERWGSMAWVGAALILGSSLTAQLAGGDDTA